MLVLKMQQRTPEWFAVKEGRVSASCMHRILRGTPESWSKYADTLDGKGEKVFQNYAMSRGIELESAALANYLLDNPNIEVEQAGFVIHGEYDWIGASPDGLIPPTGGLEIKCPLNQQKHFDTIASGIPDEYYPQVQSSIWICEADWWDYVSYDPRTALEDRLYSIRIYRDDAFIKEIERACLRFYDFWQNRKETPVANATAVPTFF